MPDVNRDAIPGTLRERGQFLHWDAAADTPRRPHWNGDFGVSWSDPDTWHSFEEAADRAAVHDSWGIGYVTAMDNDDYGTGAIGVIDIDTAYIDGEAADWVPSLKEFEGAYAERSPSGEGIHIPFAGATVPEWWSDSQFTDRCPECGDVEIEELDDDTDASYRCTECGMDIDHVGVDVLTNKFCTVTGDVLQEGDVYEGNIAEWLHEAYKRINGEQPPIGGRGDDSKTYNDDELSEDQVREMLDHVESGLEYGDWLRVGMAVYDWDDSSRGKRLFENWSQSNAKWNEKDGQPHIDDIWSGSPDGKVTVGTLVHFAKQGGYEFSKPENRDPPDPPERDSDDDGPIPWEYVRARYQEEGPSWGRYYATEALEDRYHWMYVVESERLWVYDDTAGYFDPWGEEFASRILERNLNSYYRKAEKGEVLERLQARNQTHREELNARARDGYHLCAGNGVVDLATGELLDHSPEYKFTRGLRWDYEPASADPEPIKEFLDDITDRKADRDTLLDHLAHGLMPGHPYRAFVITYGPGSNGKTQMGKLFRGFVGEDNAASVELQDLTGDDEFATGGLPGAFVNVGDDISVSEIRDASILKSLTGGGTVRANEKFEKKFEFQNEAAMFFSANEPPRITEESDAVGDRLYPIEMPYRFVDDDEYDPEKEYHKLKEPGIADRLLENDAAMRGLLLLTVAHAQELIESKGQYSMPEGPKERRAKYEAASDPIRRFAMEYFEQGDQDQIVLKDDAYDVYAQMCELQDERVARADIFKRQVSQLPLLDIESARTRQLTPGDSIERCWRYLSFGKDAKELMSPRLRERYFPDDEGEQETFDADDAFGATALLEAAQSTTGYVTVTVDVVDTQTIADGDGLRAVLRDESGAMDIKTWEAQWVDRLQNAEGQSVALENVEVFTDDYDDTRKLAPVPGLTQMAEIQPGVGYVPDADTDSAQDRLSDVPDDARGPQANARRVRQIVEQHGGTLSETDVVQKASLETDDMDPETAEHALKTALQKGMLQKGGDGVQTT